MITRDELLQILRYDYETGNFYWLRPTRHRLKNGMRAGYVNGHGYVAIPVNRDLYMAHRLAWLVANGEWPTEIDHVNGDKTDNRIANLRQCTRAENEANKPRSRVNTSGYRGVRQARTPGKWYAQIRRKGKLIHLGSFDTAQDARSAYVAAAESAYGQFAGHLNRDST